jgi:hypothetical protein
MSKKFFDLTDALNYIEADVMRDRDLAAEAASKDAIGWLRSKTNVMQPGVRPPSKGLTRGGERRKNPPGPPRRAHPGLWADITGNLQSSYQEPKQRREGDNLIVRFESTREYAVMLEGKTRKGGGEYWVLSGLIEHKDSPIPDKFVELFNRRRQMGG